jgi:predicted enzyme related to lactoylglutathione lyase
VDNKGKLEETMGGNAPFAGGQMHVGSLVGFDLTVSDAATIRDFYAAVVGWRPTPVDMGGYSDFAMTAPASEAPVAGICHARGDNADLPPRWLAYIAVADLDASVRRCLDLGGAVVAGPKGAAPGGRYCVIRDPAGAVVALMERPQEPGTAAP